jgi:hypothetical protein
MTVLLSAVVLGIAVQAFKMISSSKKTRGYDSDEESDQDGEERFGQIHCTDDIMMM